MNTLGHDLKAGEEVILQVSQDQKEIKERTFVCEGGNGMRLNLPGAVIYGQWKLSGKSGCIRAEHIDVAATRKLQGKKRMFDGRDNSDRRVRRRRNAIR